MRKILRPILMIVSVMLAVALTASIAVGVSAASEPEVLWINHNTFSEDDEDDTTPDTLPAPVIMKFNNKNNWYQYSFLGQPINDPQFSFNESDNKLQGDYEFKSINDGSGSVTALKLNYYEYTGFAPHRVMPKFAKNSDNTLKLPLTADHKYICITYMTRDTLSNTVTIYNNARGTRITLVQDTSVSQGKWVRSTARDISEGGISGGMLDRFLDGSHCTFEYTNGTQKSEFYIKEIGFFASAEQANDYYEDGEQFEEMNFSKMTFDITGTGTTLTGVAENGTTYGTHSVNAQTGDLEITYDATGTNMYGYDSSAKTTAYKFRYMAKVKFKNKSYINSEHRFMRVLYAADHPDSFTAAASMYMRNDGKDSETIRLSDNVVDTNGKYVLTDTVYLPDGIISRFSTTIHCSLVTNTNVEGATYKIKAIYFFPSRAIADEFTYTDTTSTVTLGGNDIANYQIVIAEDAPLKIVDAAEMLVSRVRTLTGHNLPIVTDSCQESDYEILVGVSNRELSYSKNDQAESPQSAFAFMDGTTFVISSPQPLATKAIMDDIIGRFLSANIAADFSYDYTYSRLDVHDWGTYGNVSEPDRYYDRFGFDNGFWTEENAANNWYFEDGTYNSDGNGKTLSYLHTYEPDVEYNMDIMYTDADSDGDMGLMLRYNSADAYIKAGYDFELDEWHITSREGADFYKVRKAIRASETVEIEPNTWYSLKFIVDGTTATLSVDGEEILCAEDITQLTPGRIAVYADNVSMRVDNADIYMLSGEGTVIPNVAHTKLETDKYTEGGTVHELNDGSLVYHHQNGYGFYSYDNGVSWVEGEPCFPTSYGYMNVIRLLPTEGQKHGDFMQIITYDGKKYSATSSDEGETWVIGENPICKVKYQDTQASAGNMNDKLFQSAKTGRIFYCQNYETTGAAVNGRMVFCEFYYSDDHGNSWTKSNTDSWTIGGNGNQTYFGECKILECADGTIRMYNSWNQYGCIVYSESTNNGETFGPLVKMENFPCSRSSMQFVRDPYAENDTTYYMVWVNAEGHTITDVMPRSRLTLAKSTDGKNWEVLGDVWRWESNYKINGAFINHIVDPFVQVTEDYVIVGSGFSENTAISTDAEISSYHQSQRQHIYSIKKSTLGAELPPLEFPCDANNDGVTTLKDLTVFNRYLASWKNYTDEKYDFSDFDINDDGSVNPLDAVLFARHLADWNKYKDLSLIKYIPSPANDRYIMTKYATYSAQGTPSEVGLYKFYGDDTHYYRYDNCAVELETGTKVTVYSTVQLGANRVYRVDENNVVYEVDELIGALDNTSHNSTNHWLYSKVVYSCSSRRNYAKYGITDVTGDNIVKYNDWKWYQSRLYGTSATEANAKISEYAKALTAVINAAIDNGQSSDNANYASLAANTDGANLNAIKAFVKPYIDAKVKLAEDGSGIKFETIPQSIHDVELQTANTSASFDSDGNLILEIKGEIVIDASDNVTELVVVNQDNLAIWRSGNARDETLKVINHAPQVAVIGKPGQDNAYGKFFEKSLADHIAVVMVGTINTDE